MLADAEIEECGIVLFSGAPLLLLVMNNLDGQVS
jgi:hypothetical protein